MENYEKWINYRKTYSDYPKRIKKENRYEELDEAIDQAMGQAVEDTIKLIKYEKIKSFCKGFLYGIPAGILATGYLFVRTLNKKGDKQ